MKTTKVRRTPPIFVTVWRPATRILVCSFLLIATAQNLQPHPAWQSRAHSLQELPSSTGAKGQGTLDIPYHVQVLAKFEQRSTARHGLSAGGTEAPLFYDEREPQYATGNGPTSVAVGDFNGDGASDLAVVNSEDNTVSVLLGKGDATFQAHLDYPTGSGPSSVLVAEFNGDGKPDLAVATAEGISVLLGNSDGSFQTHVDSATAIGAMALADFNRDGKLDLAVAWGQYFPNVGHVSVLLGNGDGTFRTQLDNIIGHQPVSVAVGDFNADGNMDFITANRLPHCSTNPCPTATVDVLLGNGDGTLQPYQEYPIGSDPYSLVAGDFNRDGKPDIAIAKQSSIGVLLGNGDGTFRGLVDYDMATNPLSLVLQDFNGDGNPDLLTTNRDSTVSVLLGEGDGTFQARLDYPTGGGPVSISLGDFNGDRKSDLAVTHYSDNSVSVLLGNGNGTLQDPRPYYVTGTNPQSLAAADFNGDGRPDLAVVNADSTLNVLLQTSSGRFQEHMDYAVRYSPKLVVAGDFNGDGKPDLVTANYGYSSVSVLLGKGDGTFQPPMDYPGGDRPNSVVAGDFNQDGKTDLAVSYEIYGNPVTPDCSIRILLGNGDGTFQNPVDYTVGKRTHSVITGDFNGDGKLDLVATHRPYYNIPYLVSGTIGVLLGNGDGTFQPEMEYPLSGDPTWLAVGDFNSDGKQDLTIAKPTFQEYGSLSVMLGNGDGTFQTEVVYLCCRESFSLSSVAVADFNNDGKQDLATTDEQFNRVSVLLGNGDGTFQGSTTYANGQGHLAATVADFNSDGVPDLAYITVGNAVGILLNMRGTVVELQSSANPSGMDQSVTLTATTRTSLKGVTGIGTPTGKVAFAEGTVQLGNQTLDGNGVATLVAGPFSTGEHDITAIYSGDPNFNPSTSGTLIQVVKGPDFGMSTAPHTATLKAGSSADVTVTSTAVYGFEGSVSLSCTVSPTPALAPTCALDPQSWNLAQNGSATAKLTITTTGPTASLDHSLGQGSYLYALGLPIFSLTLLGAGFGRSRKKQLFGALLLILVLASISLQVGCGGGGSSVDRSHIGSSGTPPGQYTVTVNATSGSITHSIAVTITVQ